MKRRPIARSDLEITGISACGPWGQRCIPLPLFVFERVTAPMRAVVGPYGGRQGQAAPGAPGLIASVAIVRI